METFGEKLKKLREKSGLSQDQLATELFVSRSAVAKWEQGRGFPNIESLQLISKKFGVTIDELVDDKELKILELKTDKKLSARKIIIIVLSAVLAAMVIAAVIIAALFAPRKLSAYMDLQPDKVSSIILRYEDYERVDDEVFKIVVHDIKLSEEEYGEFISELINLRVKPRYTAIKAVSKYSIFIDCDYKTYEVNTFYIKVDGKKYMYDMLDGLTRLSKYFEIIEDLI